MKTTLICLCLIACFPSLLSASETPPWQITRKWTTLDGKFKTEARFVGEIDGAYVLKKTDDGKLIEISKKRLSEADHQFVEQNVSLQPQRKEEARAEVALPSYSVISDTSLKNIKRSVDVRLQTRLTEEQLTELAKEIQKKSPKQYERTFICYYLPDMEPGAGAWATSHFEKDKMDVRFTGIEPSTAKPKSNASDSINMDNYNKIKVGMALPQVEKILGRKAEDSTDLDYNGATEKGWYGKEKGGITVQFKNGKVISKNQIGLK